MFPKESRFIIIDDFATMRKIIKKVLVELGYTNIDEADDGAKALPMIELAVTTGNPYACIISDWNMPVMQGIDLLKNCKANEKLKSTPFVLVTAEGEQKQIIEAAKAGVSDYIVKPFNALTLKEKLQKVYIRHHGNAAA